VCWLSPGSDSGSLAATDRWLADWLGSFDWAAVRWLLLVITGKTSAGRDYYSGNAGCTIPMIG